MQIPSGYKTITPIQFTNVVWTFDLRLIDAHGLRVYFACFELTAIREAAGRTRRKRGEKPRDLARYRLVELERLTKLAPEDVRRALRQLEGAGLVRFAEGQVLLANNPLPGSEELLKELACRRSPQRPIPVPRRLLRFLAKNRSVSLTKTIMAYLLRGLSIARRTGEINAKGTVKASWIAENFGLCDRAVRYAQAWLHKAGWMTKDVNSHQNKLNRHGAYFALNLDCHFQPADETQPQISQPQVQPRANLPPVSDLPLPPQISAVAAPLTEPVIVNRDKSAANFAPLPSKTAPVFAPPKEDKETSKENKNQNPETHLGEPLVAGLCKMENEIPPAKSLPAPNLSHIRPEDLRRLDRLNVLYQQAVARGWLLSSEAGALNFVAAAVRAREVGERPGPLFVTLVRRQLWRHITLAQEERARRALARYREFCPQGFHNGPPVDQRALAA